MIGIARLVHPSPRAGDAVASGRQPQGPGRCWVASDPEGAHRPAAGDAREVSAIVATSVRVAAGWDRTQPAAAAINRLRVIDHLLDTATGTMAAAVADELTGVSVADAHIGAAIRSLPHDEV
ncbi:MAG: hypothetical protein R6T85_00755, partial [Egibacteraceae bacterium]